MATYEVMVKATIEVDDDLVNHPNFGIQSVADSFAKMAINYSSIGASKSEVVEMKNISVKDFKIGDTVKLKASVVHNCPEGRQNNRTAKISAFLDIAEGAFMTNTDLRGCRYWNLEDVEHADA